MSHKCVIFPGPRVESLPSKAPGDHHLLSPGHAEYRLLRWGHLQCLPSQQWSKAGLCPCSNPLRDFLLDAAPVCLFVDCTEGVYVRPRSDSKLFNIVRLRTKSKAYVVLIRELLFADDFALTSHSEEGLQHLVDKLSHACKEFGLTISLRKTKILAQGPESPPVITIDNTELEVVDTFTYLGSTVSSSTSLDTEISCRIAKAAAVMAKLNKRVLGNDLLSERPKMCVCQACVLSTLLYGSESWTTYGRQERLLNAFHLRCLQVAGQSHQHRVPGARWLTEHAITARSATPSIARPCTSHGA